MDSFFYFPVNESQGMFLYSSNHSILLRHKRGEQISRFYLLATDFLSDFDSVIYDNTIYYCYQNLQHQIIVKNLSSNTILYESMPDSKEEIYNLSLVCFQKKLLLFYCKARSTCSIYCFFPLNQDVSPTPFSTNKEKLHFSLLPFDTYILFHITSKQFKQTLLLNDSFDFAELKNEETFYQHKYHDLEQSVKQKQSVIADLTRQCEEKNIQIQKQSAIFNSIKQQYDDLMHVAQEYRNEAIKWRNQFIQSK